MTLHVISSPKVIPWVAERITDADMLPDADACVAFGVLKDKRPIAGILWSEFREMRHGNDVRVTVAAEDPRWCLPGVLRQLFDYPFNTLKCTRITSIIREGNHRSLKVTKGLGFRQEGVARRAYNGKSNAIILGLLRDECRWLD